MTHNLRMIKRLTDQSIAGKRVLIRADLNVPLEKDRIRDDTRIQAVLPTLLYVLEHGAAVILMTHLGRPVEGAPAAELSVQPIAARLNQLLGQPVPVLADWQTRAPSVAAGKIVLLENVRSNVGEKANLDALGKAYAGLGDIFVNDAFATAHRAEASTCAVARYAPVACAGLLLMAELAALEQAFDAPRRPLIAIVGGSKVSSKLTLLHQLAERVDGLIVGGGIANTFLLAEGYAIGQSLAEPTLTQEAAEIIQKIRARNAALPLPIDVITTKTLGEGAQATLRPVAQLRDQEMIVDIGPNSIKAIVALIDTAQTIFWNGPVGVFEHAQFSAGTRALAQHIAQSAAFSVAGGGDTLAAIEEYGIKDQISYRSTGGGAFLALASGASLPAVEYLQSASAPYS